MYSISLDQQKRDVTHVSSVGSSTPNEGHLSVFINRIGPAMSRSVCDCFYWLSNKCVILKICSPKNVKLKMTPPHCLAMVYA